MLNLDLGPIDLDLLGVLVHLDETHLDVQASDGDGELLGTVVCQLAGLLDGLDLSGLGDALSGAVQKALTGLVKDLAGSDKVKDFITDKLTGILPGSDGSSKGERGSASDEDEEDDQGGRRGAQDYDDEYEEDYDDGEEGRGSSDRGAGRNGSGDYEDYDEDDDEDAESSSPRRQRRRVRA
ncbi:MAG TPA: hypothetical protein VFP54_03325 [Acidimicrobiales bacterium]|nr:hypothetical protein [Acidimicrobiales bacterium]